MTEGVEHRQPTLSDVARRAGVSRSLASLALRGEAGVRPDKRDRIFKAAAELNYHPNLIARTLASAGAHSIGVVVGRIVDPLQAAVVQEIDRIAVAAGYDVLLSITAETDEGAEQSVRMLMARRVAGVLLVGAPRAKSSIARVAKMVAATYIGRLLASVEIDSVSTDDRFGARMAVDHLVSLGHENIAHVSGGNEPGAIRRREGYEAAMADHGLEALVIDGGYTVDDGASGMLRLFDRGRRPSAVFCAHDLSAFGLMSEAHRMRVAVPGMLSVVGYGDVELAATDTLALTTINQPAAQLAEAGVNGLIQRIGKPSTPVTKTLVEPSLVVRHSTASPDAIRTRTAFAHLKAGSPTGPEPRARRQRTRLPSP
ncbi:MAG TPA: LacI family DNA-binding transcriptional regulator [Bauldia sp.]|nr:LacI family DNA-binding transcriptional regulator [Bauldia sp.]